MSGFVDQKKNAKNVGYSTKATNRCCAQFIKHDFGFQSEFPMRYSVLGVNALPKMLRPSTAQSQLKTQHQDKKQAQDSPQRALPPVQNATLCRFWDLCLCPSPILIDFRFSQQSLWSQMVSSHLTQKALANFAFQYWSTLLPIGVFMHTALQATSKDWRAN